MGHLNRIEESVPVRERMLVFGAPCIEEPEIREVVATLRSGWIGTGPKVARFQKMFSEYIGCRYALAVNSCTAALHLAMIVAGVKRGDSVITTPMTFAATANAIIHTGATPLFVDIRHDTMNIDPVLIGKYIEENCVFSKKRRELKDKVTGSIIKALVPVHFAGRPCEMEHLIEIAKEYNLLVIEDAAHAIEASYKGRKIGDIGDITCFSFYVTKNIMTGEGGMITTNKEAYADKIKVYALHGMSKDAWKRYSDEGFKHYQILHPGFKYNMMDIQASIGIHQLPRVGKYWERRRQIWQRYNRAFASLPVITPLEPEENTRHSYHLYTLLLDIDLMHISRDEFQQALYTENIGTGIHYTALHLQDYYARAYGYRRGDFPNAEYISDRTISLPLSPALTDEDVESVIAGVRKVISLYSGT